MSCKNATIALLAPLSGPAATRRQGAAALGAVRRVPQQPDARRDEGQPGARSTRSWTPRRPRRRRSSWRRTPACWPSPGPRSATRSGRRPDLRPEPARVHLRLGDADVADDRRRQGADLLPHRRHRLRAEHDRRRLHPQGARREVGLDRRRRRATTACRSPTAWSGCCARTGVTVTRDSVPQTQTDFSLLVSQAPRDAQVVFLPWLQPTRGADDAEAGAREGADGDVRRHGQARRRRTGWRPARGSTSRRSRT